MTKYDISEITAKLGTIKERTIHRSRNRAPRMTERNEAPETRILEQIQGLMGEILRKSSEGEGYCLYRGEPECYPIVSSGLYRKCPDCKNEAFDIERIQQEIIENARHYTTLEDADDILAEIQHFGGATNLLDFTDDYLIALFFASVDSEGKDGRVVLHWPNGKTVIRPKHTNNRVVFQKSVFVRPRRGFIVPQPAEEIVVVRAELKRHIQAFLERFHGITERTVYNDIHGYIRHQNPSRSPYAVKWRETLAKPRRDPSFDLEHCLAAKLEKIELVRMRHYWHQKGMDYTDGAMSELAIRAAKEDLEQTTLHRLDLKPEEVIELFTHCIVNKHRSVQLQDAYCWRGHTLLFQGLNDRAFGDFEKVLEMDDEFAGAYHGRANVYRQQDNTGRAMEDLEKALDLQPDFPAVLIDQGNLHRDHGSLKDAVRNFSAVIGRSSKGSQYTWFRDALFFRAVARCIEKDWLAAESDLELARREGLRVASSFRNVFGSVAKFEADYNLKITSLIATQFYVA